MAALAGRLQGGTGKAVTRTATRIMDSTLSTWEGSVTTRLKADGSFEVELGPAIAGGGRSDRKVIASGNVSD